MIAPVLTMLSLSFAAPHATTGHGFTPTRFVTVQGVRLAVYESEGRGPDVLLVHGNTSSAQSYERVFESRLAREYHLVALDLPGYGRSENASTYSVDLFTTAIASVAQATGADDGVLVGWSLGGDLALQARHKLPELKGIFIFGTAPVGLDPSLPSPFLTASESYAGDAVNYGLIANLTNEQIDAYVTAFFRPSYDDIPAFFFRDGYRTDPGTRAAVYTAATFQDPDFLDEVTLTRSLDIPLAVVLADTDAFVNPEQLFALAPSLPTLWRDDIQFVRHSGHATQWEHVGHFAQLLDAFVTDVQ